MALDPQLAPLEIRLAKLSQTKIFDFWQNP